MKHSVEFDKRATQALANARKQTGKLDNSKPEQTLSALAAKAQELRALSAMLEEEAARCERWHKGLAMHLAEKQAKNAI